MGKCLGTHAIFDLEFNIDEVCLYKPDTFMDSMRESILDENSTIIKEECHAFPSEGDGFTFTFILAESHASCHTWPEYGLATLDIYMCGECDSFRAMENFISKVVQKGFVVNKRHETKLFRGYVNERNNQVVT